MTESLDTALDERIAAHVAKLSGAEQRVARFFQARREDVIVSSAAKLAAEIGISDATIIRTMRKLGFDSLDALRRLIASDLRHAPSPAGRVAATLQTIGENPDQAFQATLAVQTESLARLGREISAAHFQHAVKLLLQGQRVVAFGIGPSALLAQYFVLQLRRFGLQAGSLTSTGLLFADDLQTLRAGDVLFMLAYGKVYRELDVLLTQAGGLHLSRILVTDTLGATVRERVDLVLPVARGRAEMFSMHTATLALMETLLVGIAAKRPAETLDNLESLDALRRSVAGGGAKQLGGGKG